MRLMLDGGMDKYTIIKYRLLIKKPDNLLTDILQIYCAFLQILILISVTADYIFGLRVFYLSFFSYQDSVISVCLNQ